MNLDRRFAVIIGINDYDIKPLNYCVNDALAVASILEERCRFNKTDIYTITSDKNKPLKDISGHLESALKKIESVIKPEMDSIFFYFAGHGEYHFEKSGLKFQDSIIEIQSIFEKINLLNPKYQCYVIDACESGGKVITRGNSKATNLIENYISKSSGVLFMYAATENESAKEFENIEHGLFTYYFLSAIKNEDLYDDGLLTQNRIHDYITKETSKESRFKQTPVIENRTIGYYPFAFKVIQKNDMEEKQEIQNENSSKENTTIDKEYFPVIPPEIRTLILTELKATLENSLKEWENEFKIENYSVEFGRSFDIFNSDIQDKLTDGIVETADKENVGSVKGVFETISEEITPNNLFGMNSLIDMLSHKKNPKFRHYRTINFNDNRVIVFSANLKADTIYQVSCGITFLIYQAIYGIGLAKSSFYLDFTGYSDTEIKGAFTGIESFKINEKTTKNIFGEIKNHIVYFKNMIEKWSEDRKKSIDAFDRKSK